MANYREPNTIEILKPGASKDVSLDEVATWPMALFNANMDWIKGGNRRFYHDIVINSAGTAQTPNGYVDLFRSGIGDGGLVWNTTAEFRKTDFHTNMFRGGQFEFGVSVIVTAFELLYIALPAKAAVVGTGDSIGTVTDSNDHATQPTGYNPLSFTRAMMLQNTYRFHRGARVTEEEGLFIDIPSSVGLSASFGGGATLALVQNSLGAIGVTLKKPKVLRSAEDFFIRLTSRSALLQPVDFVAFWRMDCVELRDTLTA
jgi:hypothetical protein